MEQLFLSSQNLAANTVLAQGSIDIAEALRKHASQKQSLLLRLPRTFVLHWQEIRTPRIQAEFANGLISNKLQSYKFQYLGKFEYNDQPIEAKDWEAATPEYESFSAAFSDRPIVKSQTAGTGLCNVTWLLDFLMNADAIAQDSTRKESLRFDEVLGSGWVLTLTADTLSYTEREQFFFKKDFSAVKWQHHTIFK